MGIASTFHESANISEETEQRQGRRGRGNVAPIQVDGVSLDRISCQDADQSGQILRSVRHHLEWVTTVRG
ncbi:MAG: hypothetical protein Q9228_007195 [Teloschistes exilis]